MKARALAGNGVAVDTDVLHEQVENTAYFRQFAAPLGGRHSLLAFPRLRGNVVAALMLGRGDEGWAAREQDAVAALLPALAVACASYARSPRDGDETGRLEQALPSPWGLRVPWTEHRTRGPYREMVALDGQRELVWTRSERGNPCRSGFAYVDVFHVAAALASARKRALFIGCGGGVAPRQFARLYPGIAIDVVERDARVIALAKRWFALDDIPHARIIQGDGAELMATAESNRWDVVLCDAYGSADDAPALEGRAFFEEVRRALVPGGAIAVNVIGSLTGMRERRVIASAARSFPDLRVVPVGAPSEAFAPETRRNIVLVGTNR
ncbi:MAG: fused MFS/spermidine synthase [Myxococcales bacterium]|nr:fused MFS/spermidine synthase [Myxococcales bacterium]